MPVRLLLRRRCVIAPFRVPSQLTQRAECQRKDWAQHKGTCRSLKGGTWVTLPFVTCIPGREDMTGFNRHDGFDHVLREVTKFRPPESVMDTGIYELKDECFDEVNPFFFHYTRNKREEVEAILKARLKKITSSTDSISPASITTSNIIRKLWTSLQTT